MLCAAVTLPALVSLDAEQDQHFFADHLTQAVYNLLQSSQPLASSSASKGVLHVRRGKTFKCRRWVENYEGGKKHTNNWAGQETCTTECRERDEEEQERVVLLCCIKLLLSQISAVAIFWFSKQDKVIHSRSSFDLLQCISVCCYAIWLSQGHTVALKKNLSKNRTLQSQVQSLSCSFKARRAKAFLYHSPSNGAVVTHIRCSCWDATALYLWSLYLFLHVVFPEAFVPTDLLLQGLRQVGNKADSLHLPCVDWQLYIVLYTSSAWQHICPTHCSLVFGKAKKKKKNFFSAREVAVRPIFGWYAVWLKICVSVLTHMLIFTQCTRGVCPASEGPCEGPGLPAAALWAEGRGEPMMWRDSMLTANAPVTGQPHSTAQQHLCWCPTKWCLYSSGSVSVGVSPCVAASIQCVSSSVCMCACVMDSEQTLSVRGAASQLIRCGRCSYQVLQQLLLTPPSIFPKWQASSIKKKRYCAECLNLVTDEPADVCSGAVWAVIVPFHTGFHLFADHLLRVTWRLWFGQLFCLQRFYLQFWHSAAEFQIFVSLPSQRAQIIIR